MCSVPQLLSHVRRQLVWPSAHCLVSLHHYIVMISVCSCKCYTIYNQSFKAVGTSHHLFNLYCCSLGAGIFVTTVVAGSVALVKPLTVASRPFLRDVIFYMAAVFWTFSMLYKRVVYLGEALGVLLFLCVRIPSKQFLIFTFTRVIIMYIPLPHPTGYLGLYLLYVITVVVSAYIYNRQSRSPHGPEPITTDFSQGEKRHFHKFVLFF